MGKDYVLYLVSETNPHPKGGMETFYKYVYQNLQYPDSARIKGIEGKVYVQFVVDKDGKVLAVKAIHGIQYGCDQEAERVIRESPDWEPGRQKSEPVYVQLVLPITYKVDRTGKRSKKESR